MMKAWLRGGALLSAVAALVLLAGCARPLKDQVVGDWQRVNGEGKLTFLGDGTISAQGGPLQISGTYTVPDEKHLKVQPSGVLGNIAGAQIWDAEMKDGRLLLTISGSQQEFKKIE